MGLKGTTIILINKKQIGEKPTGEPIFTEIRTAVPNVLIGEPDTQDITDEINLTGKRIAYVLGIPKGDANDWEDALVEFYGERYRTIGKPMQGMPANMTRLRWNKKVKVERYGSSKD